MPLTSHAIVNQQPYTLTLSFNGIARYAVMEYVPDGNAWKLGKIIRTDGNSADDQADVYSLTPLAVGEKRLVAIGANMSSATGDEDVAMTATFTQGGKAVHSDQQSGHDSGNVVMLWSRAVFVGVA